MFQGVAMPICVFDIFADGTTQVPTDTHLTGPGIYRWWHFDLADPMLEPWVREHLHEIPAGSLIQKQTRPRCDRFEGGLILNLRGINMNEGQDADEMVSVRMYVDSDLLITVRRKKVFAIDGSCRRSLRAGRREQGRRAGDVSSVDLQLGNTNGIRPDRQTVPARRTPLHHSGTCAHAKVKGRRPPPLWEIGRRPHGSVEPWYPAVGGHGRNW